MRAGYTILQKSVAGRATLGVSERLREMNSKAANVEALWLVHTNDMFTQLLPENLMGLIDACIEARHFARHELLHDDNLLFQGDPNLEADHPAIFLLAGEMHSHPCSISKQLLHAVQLLNHKVANCCSHLHLMPCNLQVLNHFVSKVHPCSRTQDHPSTRK